MNNEKTGALIAALRKEKGLTQEQLGEQVYVSGKAVSKWERGLSFPSVDVLEKLAEVLGITVTELLAGERVAQEEQLERAQRQALQMLRQERRRVMAIAAGAGAVCLLILGLLLNQWGGVLFQRGNPIPYLWAATRISEEQPYVPVKVEGVNDVYISRSRDCPELFAMVEETRQVTFVEQMGSGFVFTNGVDGLNVSSEIYWKYFTVWQVPTRTLQK